MKAVSFSYKASAELTQLFDKFRNMCNDAIGIAALKRPANRLQLIELAYPRLKEYGLHTHYILSACEVAYSLFRNKRRKSVPRITRPFLKLDNQSYRLNHLLLRIPTSPRSFVFLTLQGSSYHCSFIDDPTLRRGSVTVTDRTVIIAFAKHAGIRGPIGSIGIDLNERNVTVSSTDGWEHRYDELNEVADLKERYKEIRAKIGRMKGRDRRKCKELLAKYGRRERHRTAQRIHKATREIVDHASKGPLCVKMENLKRIRRLYLKGNGQGRSYRGRMNSWVFGETQRQVDYKAKWEGIPTYYVDPRGTSSYCPNCGSRVAPLAGRKLYCPRCDKEWDRDDLASKNIMACAVPQARPSKGNSEGERGDGGSNPLSRWREGKPRG